MIFPSQDNILKAMKSFLQDPAVLDATPVYQGQDNRVPEPQDTTFVIMTIFRAGRLGTNFDTPIDAVFTGFIDGEDMTITAVDPKFHGKIVVGSFIFGVGLEPNTRVTEVTSGTGGVGTYTLSKAQDIASQTLAAGIMQEILPADVVMQLDFHGDSAASGDQAMLVAALLRDEFGVRQFAGQVPQYGVVPLYVDDMPRQIPYQNDQQQIEWRWVLDCHLQANFVISTPQQFMDMIHIDRVVVDALPIT